MVANIEEPATEEQKVFNDLSIEEKKDFIKTKGWPDFEIGRDGVAVSFKLSCFVNEKLDSDHRYLDYFLRERPLLKVPACNRISIYYDNGLKMDIDTFSQEAGDEVKTIPLMPGELAEFSYHKYAPFDEKYSLTIDDIKFGITLDV